jgi:hypothetical protein
MIDGYLVLGPNQGGRRKAPALYRFSGFAFSRRQHSGRAKINDGVAIA